MIRLIQSDDLAAEAVVDVTAGVVMVRSTLSPAARRRAVRDALAPHSRFPGLVMFSALAGFHARRAAVSSADWVAGFGQHAAAFAANNPVPATIAAVVALAAGTAGGVATGVVPMSPFTAGPGGAQVTAPPRPVYAHLKPYPASYLGVYEAGTPGSFAPVEQFGQTVGHTPNLALYYIGWGEPFHAAFAQAAIDHGATPVVQLNPYGVTLASVADGTDDRWLISYAQAIHAWGKNIVISFGHEMNGHWYPWGWKRSDPQVFVEAWRHVVNVFRAEGDFNVTWLWTINRNAPAVTGPIRDWWPGKNYVTWVGIDGYYYTAGDTFKDVFGATVADVRALTADPILIAETAADPPEQPEAKQIAGLFSGIRRKQILGFIWYDATGHQGNQWRLEGNPQATRAFRHAARGYGSAPVQGTPRR